MRFCANCGEGYGQSSGVCVGCSLDQTLPEALIDLELQKRRARTFVSEDPPFGYPGEKGALRLAILASLGLGAALGTLTLGIFVLLFAQNLISLRIHHVRFKNSLVQVGEKSFRKIFRLAKVAAYRLKLPLPEVYVTQDPTYNAFTMGFGRYGFIVINSSLLEDFSPQEILFIIAHEMGHIKRFHTTWLNLMGPGMAEAPRFLFASAIRPMFNTWSIKAEYTADQAGLIACDDLGPTLSALMKVAAGRGVKDNMEVQRIARDGKENEEVLSTLVELLGTHPFIQNRVTHLRSFAESGQYRSARWWAAAGRGGK